MGSSTRPSSIPSAGALVPLALAAAAAVATLLAASSAWAGPRVGEIVGRPSTTASTVQAKVISATPVVGQVTVPRRECFDELRREPARSNGAGAILGAIAGGAVGNTMGKGGGKALTTGLGILGGAILGDHIQNDGRQGTMRTVRRCEEQPAFENRVVGYNVVYEYGGQRYTTQLDHEPGRTIPVQVTLAPVSGQRGYQQSRYEDDGHGGDDWDDADGDGYDEEEEVYTPPPPPPRHHRHIHRSWY